MPRRRKIEIKASELECYETLVAELSRRVEFVDFDMASLRVWAYESYEQELKGVEKSLRRLDHWLAAHRNELFIINMQGERLRISLVTLTDWVNRGKICAHKIGGRVLFRESDVEAALNQIIPIKR